MWGIHWYKILPWLYAKNLSGKQWKCLLNDSENFETWKSNLVPKHIMDLHWPFSKYIIDSCDCLPMFPHNYITTWQFRRVACFQHGLGLAYSQHFDLIGQYHLNLMLIDRLLIDLPPPPSGPTALKHKAKLTFPQTTTILVSITVYFSTTQRDMQIRCLMHFKGLQRRGCRMANLTSDSDSSCDFTLSV